MTAPNQCSFGERPSAMGAEEGSPAFSTLGGRHKMIPEPFKDGTQSPLTVGVPVGANLGLDFSR